MNKLTKADFPLWAIGTLIYARSQSSPILTADWPERAEQIVAWLNAHEGIISSMVENGPTLVTLNGRLS
jgi:hypothetical protein